MASGFKFSPGKPCCTPPIDCSIFVDAFDQPTLSAKWNIAESTGDWTLNTTDQTIDVTDDDSYLELVYFWPTSGPNIMMGQAGYKYEYRFKATADGARVGWRDGAFGFDKIRLQVGSTAKLELISGSVIRRCTVAAATNTWHTLSVEYFSGINYNGSGPFSGMAIKLNGVIVFSDVGRINSNNPSMYVDVAAGGTVSFDDFKIKTLHEVNSDCPASLACHWPPKKESQLPAPLYVDFSGVSAGDRGWNILNGRWNLNRVDDDCEYELTGLHLHMFSTNYLESIRFSWDTSARRAFITAQSSTVPSGGGGAAIWRFRYDSTYPGDICGNSITNRDTFSDASGSCTVSY